MAATDLLQVMQAEKAFGSKQLFQGATFSIGEGEHVGVIGPNGAGKTTLFKILAGQESLDGGEIVRSRALRIGYLPQHDEWGAGETVEDFLSRSPQIPLWTLKRLAVGLGIDNRHFNVPVTSLSGGYRMRVKLLALIGQDPNLMLLDEPTNYLDLETLVVLENFLQSYSGAFLLISHDREFLRRTCSETLEIESGDINKYPGTIDDYFEQKALIRSQLEARAASLADKKAAILDFVNRFGAKATKARQAQSRLKTLDKMETIELAPLPVRARIRIPEPERTGKTTLAIKGAALGYGDRQIVEPFDLLVERGDHVVVVGLNGAGKTTLLKSLAGELPTLQGSIERGHEVSVGYYAQHVSEKLNLNHKVLEAIEEGAHRSQTRQDALDLAGSLLFSGSDVQKPISVLSGGERSRVALGRILLERSTCLILDEPTNHLDFDTVEALTQALVEYPGTVIVVSHDRSFARRIGTKILEIDGGRVTLHTGTYDDYVWRVQRDALARTESPAESGTSSTPRKESEAESSKESLSQNAQYRESKKALDRELKQAEKAIEQVEAKVSKLTGRVAELQGLIRSTVDDEKNLKHVAELNQVQTELHPLEEEWVHLCENREKTEAAIRALMREHC